MQILDALDIVFIFLITFVVNAVFLDWRDFDAVLAVFILLHIFVFHRHQGKYSHVSQHKSGIKKEH